MSPIDVFHLATAVVAVLSGMLALLRMSTGPGLLDRTVATDVLTAAGIGILAVMVVWWQRVDLGVLLVILALTAFMTAVVVTRYAVREDASSKRILTREESERLDRERAEAEIAAEQAELEEAARLARGEESGDEGDDDSDEGDSEEDVTGDEGEAGGVVEPADDGAGDVEPDGEGATGGTPDVAESQERISRERGQA